MKSPDVQRDDIILSLVAGAGRIDQSHYLIKVPLGTPRPSTLLPRHRRPVLHMPKPRIEIETEPNPYQFCPVLID